MASWQLAAVLGVGFASGRETMHFFVRHGAAAILGAATGALAFVTATLAFLTLSGAGLAPPARVAYAAATLATLAVLLAGGAEVLRDLLPPGAALLAFALLTYAVVRLPRRRVGPAQLVAQLLTVGALLVVTASGPPSPLTVRPPDAGALADAALYGAFNALLSLPQLHALRTVYREASLRQGAVLAGLVFGLLLVAYSRALLPHALRLRAEPLPLLQLADTHLASVCLTALLGLATLTAAQANLRALAGLIPGGVGLLLAAAALLATAGVVGLVGRLYPIMGLGAVLALVGSALRPRGDGGDGRGRTWDGSRAKPNESRRAARPPGPGRLRR